MHRSRVGVILVDVPDGSFDAATSFWGAVTGADAEVGPDGVFAAVGTLGGGIRLEAQRLPEGEAARVHLDVETDDVPAEVARLVDLGATVEAEHEKHTILRDPAGLLLCVVPVWTDGFDDNAVTWP